jgi:hypothetical protein
MERREGKKGNKLKFAMLTETINCGLSNNSSFVDPPSSIACGFL